MAAVDDYGGGCNSNHDNYDGNDHDSGGHSNDMFKIF